jgi:hypothetical protein
MSTGHEIGFLHPLFAPVWCALVRTFLLYSTFLPHLSLVLVVARMVSSSAAMVHSRVHPDPHRTSVGADLHSLHVLPISFLPPRPRSISVYSGNIHRCLPALSLPSSCQVSRASPRQGLKVVGIVPRKRRPTASSFPRPLFQIWRGCPNRT